MKWTTALFILVSFSLAGCSKTAEEATVSEQIIWPGESWATSTPEAEGIDPGAIQALVDDIEKGEYGLVDAFMLIRNGKVVADYRFQQDYLSIFAQRDQTDRQYNYDHPNWHPYLKDTQLHTLQSVTKSVTSAAIGIAIDRGLMADIDQPVMNLFEEYLPYVDVDRKQATRLEDLLTMQSGLAWEDPKDTDALEGGDRWIEYVLSKPLQEEPGKVFKYNNGVSVLLGKALRESTGQRIDEWARENLFKPIGINDFYWKITPEGEVDTEGGLYLSTPDLARFGYLFLREGNWNDKQIISKEWVKQSTAAAVRHVDLEEGRLVSYGYQWWIPHHENSDAEIYAGYGYGGQYVLVVPDYDLVAVFNGWQIHDRAKLSTRWALQERILPYIK